MKRIVRWLFAMVGGLLLSGCTIISEQPAAPVFPEEPMTAEYQKARELVIALVKNEPEKCIALLPEDKQQAFTVDQFIIYRHQVVDSLGEPTGFRYLTTIDMPVFHPFVWKVSFEHVDKEGKKIKGEALFRVTVGKSNDEILILGFQFL